MLSRLKSHSRRPEKVIYDFFGPPGAGKTYLAQKLATQEGIPITDPNTLSQRIVFSLLFLFSSPRIAFRVLWVFLKENHSNKRILLYKLKKRLPSAIAAHEKARWCSGGAITDYGFSQLILSLYERPVTHEDLQQFRACYAHTLVIRVTAKETTRLHRMQKRRRVPRAKVCTHKEVEETLALWKKNVETMSEFIYSEIPYIIIENDTDMQTPTLSIK